MKRLAISALLILLSFCLLPEMTSAQQQGVPVDGKDFYVGYVYPSFNKNPGQQGRDFHGFFNVFVLISSYEDNNQVKLSYFDAGGAEIGSVVKIISARNAVQIPLDRTSMQMTEPGDMPEYRACHITSKKPVNVQYFSTGACSGGSYLSIPTPALGKSYVIPSYNDNPDQGAGLSQQQEPAAGFFLIIAAFDGTNVTITPTATTAGGHTGVSCGNGASGSEHPYTVSLSRGQCYWVKGLGIDNSCDMSGSLVVSDKPIGVLGGHENAFLGDVGSRTLEGRDFMIEQVIPSEYWDSTGYVSIPLKDGAGTQAGDAGYGENYRVYTNNPKGAAVVLSDCDVAGKAMDVSRLNTSENNTGCAAEFHSNDGHKFGVMMYDLRDQGNGGPPHPAESMMSIVPMSRWRTSFLFFVPKNTFEVLQNYYINIIGLKKDFDEGNIRFSFDGANTLNRLTGLSSQGTYKQIPNHPELQGARFTVSPGAYYFTNVRDTIFPTIPIDTMLHGAFMMYHYGMRAIDPDRDLGDFCGDDFFFSYALPIGMTVSSGGGDPKAKVDTLCSSWHICVRDSGGVTIRSVTLLDDPNGNYYRPGKKYFNTQFDPLLDPDDKKEIDFSGDDTSVCFDVFVSNPLDSAYAPLYIVDSRGAHIVLDLRYKAPHIELTKLPDFPKKLDSLIFAPTKIGDEICSTLVYINTAPKGGKAFSVSSATLKKKANTQFKIASITPQLPVNLQGGDTLKVVVCFDPVDTTASNDSVILQTDCFTAPLPIIGHGGTPLIYATDIDFGSVVVGTTVCKPLTVENRGSLPFVLTKGNLHDITKFAIDPASASRLPITIQPGGSLTLMFCYTPTQVNDQDSTSVDWINDIVGKYAGQIKPWSYLKGKPVKPGVNWDRLKQLDSVICDDSVVVRVNLLNTSTSKAHVDRVYFDGPDAAEYHIIADQLGYYPLGNFDLDTGKTIWVDVAFKADLSKGYPDRHSRIIATFVKPNDPTHDDSTVIDFTGKVQHAVLVNNPTILDFGFVTRGTPSVGFVTIMNTGDAPYVISGVDLPNPPVTGILLNGKLLGPGDTIPRGATVSLEIDATLNTFSDTTVSYHLNSNKICSGDTGQIHIAASQLKVTSTGFPAPNTFVTCREFDDSVRATNLGSVKVTLVSVDLISTPGTPNVGEFDLVDAGNKLVKTVTKNILLSHLQSVSIPIVYHPTISGPVSATVRYNWDSAGVKFTTTNIATGVGVQLKTTVSAAQVGGAPYSAPTNGSFTLPISIVNTALPANADVHRVTFRLTYRQDVLNFLSASAPASGNYTLVKPNPPTPAGGNETIDFDVSSSNAATPITNLEDIVDVKYQVMVSKELITPFTVSNVTFYDSKGASICYVIADTIPGVFVPQYICGDTSLHKYLTGVLPTRINMLSPSVVGDNETPILYYTINRADIPVKVEIFNVLGERVRTIKNTMSQPVGSYQLPIGTIGMQSGTYLVRLTTPVSSETANFIMRK